METAIANALFLAVVGLSAWVAARLIHRQQKPQPEQRRVSVEELHAIQRKQWDQRAHYSAEFNWLNSQPASTPHLDALSVPVGEYGDLDAIRTGYAGHIDDLADDRPRLRSENPVYQQLQDRATQHPEK